MIEIVSIGSEILSGNILNTNAHCIANRVNQAGYIVNRITSIGDETRVISNTIEAAMLRASIVIVTGGLGPTGDDVTREVAASLFDSELELNLEIQGELEARYGKDLESLEHQATFPKKAERIPNPVGTAQGCIFGEGKLFLLPGVPSQMKVMLESSIIPYLQRKFSPKHFLQTVHLFMLSENQVDPFLRELEKKRSGVSIGICPAYGTLAVHVSSLNKDLLQSTCQEVKEKFAAHYFPGNTLEESLHEKLIAKGETLSIAESCTGGEISSAFTKIPDASKYFLGSCVSYSNEVKKDVLGVLEETLEEKGAVSEETAIQMAEGVKKITHSSYSISTTGVAGPSGGTAQSPVGTVWIAVSRKDQKTVCTRILSRGNRQTIITHAKNAALALLWKNL